MATVEKVPATSGSWADSKTAWKKRRTHNITLDSGAQVRVTYPDMAALFQADALPAELVHVAVMDQFAPDKLRDMIGDADKERDLLRDYYEFGVRLAHAMLVEPKLSLDEFREIPPEDVEMLRDIALRQRDTDARGVKLGVVRLDVFTTFREAHERSEDVAESHPPFPDPGCRACLEAFREFSSLSEVLL